MDENGSAILIGANCILINTNPNGWKSVGKNSHYTWWPEAGLAGHPPCYLSTLIYTIYLVSRPCFLAGYRKNNIIDAVLHTLSVAVAVCDTSQQQPADADQYKWFSSAIEFLIGWDWTVFAAACQHAFVARMFSLSHWSLVPLPPLLKC